MGSSASVAFLSYARQDLATVRRVYESLKQRNLNIWFDQTDLAPGKWKPQILRAIRRSRYFLICLSQAALTKTGDEPGFQDTELNEAYNIAIDQDEAHFTIIPLRLEDCDRGDNRLSQFQQFDLFSSWDDTLDRLAVSIGGSALTRALVDARTEKEKRVEALQGRIVVLGYAGQDEKANPDVEALATILSNRNEESAVRCAAAAAMRWARPEQATVIEPLLRAIDSEDYRVQQVASESLLSLDLHDHESVLSSLLLALEKSGNPLVRFSAAGALGRIGPKAARAVEPLTRALADESWKVRRIAPEALASIGSAAKSAVGPLIEALADRENQDWVRANAALALGAIAPESEAVVAALSSALNDQSEQVRSAAREALDETAFKK